MSSENERFLTQHGDALAVMSTLPSESFDAMLCDPPYGISFMGREWDHGVPSAEVWREALRVLKPGAFALVACGTRTQHRMVTALEDAGFEVRDVIAYLYGSGFPKSHDVSKAIDKAAGAEREVVGRGKGRTGEAAQPNGSSFSDDGYQWPGEYNVTAPATPDAASWHGYGTALKPAMELWTLVRKPPEGTVAANCLRHGVGGLNIDGTRIPMGDEYDPAKTQRQQHSGGAVTGAFGAAALIGREIPTYKPGGRWPANVIHDGSDEVLDLFPHTAAGVAVRSRSGGNTFGGTTPKPPLPDMGYGDSGSAARFFMTCKPTSQEASEWNPAPANTAATPSAQPNAPADSAQDDAATSANHADNSKPHYPAPSTNGTANASNANAANATPTTPNTAPKSSPAPTPTSEPQPAHASSAEHQTQTGTTTTTTGRWTSGTSAAPATSSITPESVEPGGLASAARFMYTAKASRREREAGLDEWPPEPSYMVANGSKTAGSANGKRYERTTTNRNPHPTVKPIALTTYLARLLLPPERDTPRRMLTPFSGVGSELIGAAHAGWDEALGIELDPEYVTIARERITHWLTQPPLFTKGPAHALREP